jgi:hypothetical protein
MYRDMEYNTKQWSNRFPFVFSFQKSSVRQGLRSTMIDVGTAARESSTEKEAYAYGRPTVSSNNDTSPLSK